jgi:uncharacterized membrane protein YfcA
MMKLEGIFEYWYLFPVSILIATIAISSGIGGAVFFSPLFMLGLQIDPYTAIGAGLITELFGSFSALHWISIIETRSFTSSVYNSVSLAGIGFTWLCSMIFFVRGLLDMSRKIGKEKFSELIKG